MDEMVVTDVTGDTVKVSDQTAATYLSAVGMLRGIGRQGLQHIAHAFSNPKQVLAASDNELTERLGPRLAYALRMGIEAQWPDVWQSATEMTERHIAHGVSELAISDSRYPPLLRRIPDPPVILYVQGSLDVLQQTNAVAVVGTRTPTPSGSAVARRVAYHFASHGFAIVSGLAKGIDTAGHSGALEAKGSTIAVLPTALDTVYPAENKGLARRICEEGGALVSEYPFGQRTFKGSFVQRDRIQAGLSLAVIVVQTRPDGGTMHTAGFAKRYHRSLFCPQPLADEASAAEYEGVWQLINDGHARLFGREDYEDIQRSLVQVKHRLLSRDGDTGANNEREAMAGLPPTSASTHTPTPASEGRTENVPSPLSVSTSQPDLWSEPSVEAETSDSEPVRDRDLDVGVGEIEQVVRRRYPALTQQQFETLVERLRLRLFGAPDP